MDRLAFTKRQFEYHAWALHRVAAALEAAPGGHPEAVKLLEHVAAADRVWLTRLQGEDGLGTALWPEEGLAACAKLLEGNRAAYRGYLEGLAGADLDSEKPYRNSKGIPFRSTVADVLTQVFAHAAYHRGQIAAAMRREGVSPVNTDYITFTREAGGD